jgi:MFS family permease
MVGPSVPVSSSANATNGDEETKKHCADSSNKIAVSPTTASSPSSSSSGPSTTFPDATSSRGVFKALIIEQAMAVHLPTIIQGSSVGMRSSLIPIFARALGGSDAVIGFITAVAGIGRVISAFPSGMMVTRFGFRETMSYGMYINCLGAAIAGLAWDNTLLVVASLVFGIGTGAFFTSRAVMLSHIVGRAQRGRLMSLVGGGERWSSVIGPFLGGVVIDYLGLRACCVAIIPVALLSVLCLRSSSKLKVLDDRLLLETRLQAAAEEERDALISDNHDATSGSPSSPNPPSGSPGAAGISPTSTKPHHSSSPSTPKGRDLRSLFRNYGDLMVRIGVYSMIVITLRACRRLMLPLAAMNLGLSASMVGLVMSASFVVDATLFFLGGMVMDRFGRRYSAIPTTLNLAIGFFLLPFGTSTVTLFLVAMFFGVADSLGAGLLLTLNADHCPKAAGAEFMGLMRITQDMGQLVGPLFAGLLTSFVSFEFACWGLAAIGALNAVWAALLLPQDAHDEDAPSASAPTAASPTTVGPTTATAAVVVVEPPHRCGAESPRDDQDELRSLPNGSFTGDGKRRPPSLFPPASPFLLARAATATPPPHMASFPLGEMVTPPSSALLPAAAVAATTAGRPPPRSRQLLEESAGIDFDNSSFTSAAAEPIVAVDVSNVVPRRTQLQ